ncbi:glutathione S-transferase family protein [Sediminicoccus rosea]|uniref:Glutathione binding-like protein n=1 Tax=Sediminicoccus rosea TaxID=1225128 RepID=A0ABZ0PDE5_9PROT|nr:glutathione S-transferase N-terminal domain-containing protein [Sediminicoccus rosea]WPB83664.1 glutathione binding-like protein [Sediminicoccus rosea]
MLDIHTAPTPNGIKIPIAAEELGIPYRVIRLHLAQGDQRRPEYLAINPNGRIPAVVDHDVPDGPVPVFESGAILLHLAETRGGLIGPGIAGRAATMGWLFLQVGGLGPNFGNAGHFLSGAPEANPHAIMRFQGEARRHLQVLDTRLASQEWLDGHGYSVADIAHFCWVRSASYAGLTLDGMPRLAEWTARIAARPAVRRGLAAIG